MIEIKFKDKNMILTVKGMHKLWTLKSELIIPIEQIEGARINPEEAAYPKGWRSPGTYIPGLITAGTYRAKGNKVFWDVCNKEKTIIIDLKKNDYKSIVIEVNDPQNAVNQISKKIKN